MRAFFSAPISLLLAVACAHCGSAYVGSSTANASTASTTGGASTTTTGAVPTAGAGTGTTTGTTSSTSTTGPSTTPTLSLSIEGQSSRQQGGSTAFAQLLTDANVKVGDVGRGAVGNDGTFTITMSQVLDSGTTYTVAIYVGGDQSNGCNFRDEQWLLAIPASTSDVAVQTGRTSANQSVCGEF